MTLRPGTLNVAKSQGGITPRDDSGVTDTGRRPPDPAQEFAERVADNFFQHGDFPHYNTFLPQLVDLIATELRAGGWKSREDWIEDIRK